MIRIVLAAALLLTAVEVAVAETGPDGLPIAPGRDTMVRVCSACHGPEIVADKRLDAAGWDEVVQTMAGRGAVATDAELKEITDYLTANLGVPPAAPNPAG